MTDRSGVLGVLDDVLSTPTGLLADEVDALRIARDRIAELIAADVEYDRAWREFKYRGSGIGDIDKAVVRRAAALKACRGGL